MKELQSALENELRVLISPLLTEIISDLCEKAFKAGEDNIDYTTSLENGEWIVTKTYKINRKQWLKNNLITPKS